MITLRNLSFTYGEKKIFDGFSLDLPTDGVHCLVGPSGAGKTTLLRIIAGLIVPNSGEIQNLPQKPAFLFQENRLLSQFTALENVAAVLPKQQQAEAFAWLEAVGLKEEANAKPQKLSGGMCRRVALARTLAYKGDFLLLDEPFTGLDAGTKANMAKLILAQNTPALVVTHSEDEIALLNSASVISIGS